MTSSVSRGVYAIEELPPYQLADGHMPIEAGQTAANFAELPFAGDVGDWRLPDGRFSWHRFAGGSYWLLTSTEQGQRRFVLRVR